MLNKRTRELITRATQRWNKTEELIKLAETIQGEVVFASINELRYAGRRLIDIIEKICDNDANCLNVEIWAGEVEQYAMKAQHDAVDSIIVTLREDLDMLENDVSPEIIFGIFGNDYLEARSLLDEMSKKVTESRGQRGSREEIYVELQHNQMPVAIEFLRKVRASKDVLAARLRANELAEKEKNAERLRAEEDARIARASLDSSNANLDVATRNLRWAIASVVVALIAIIISFYK